MRENAKEASTMTKASDQLPLWQRVRHFVVALAVVEGVIVLAIALIAPAVALVNMIRPPHVFTIPFGNVLMGFVALTFIAIIVIAWATMQATTEMSARKDAA